MLKVTAESESKCDSCDSYITEGYRVFCEDCFDEAKSIIEDLLFLAKGEKAVDVDKLIEKHHNLLTIMELI
jgi:hypothetical protein